MLGPRHRNRPRPQHPVAIAPFAIIAGCAVVVAVIALALSSGSNEAPETETTGRDRKPSNGGLPSPTAAELRAALSSQLSRLNTTSLAAIYCVRASMAAEAENCRSEARRIEDDVNELAARLRAHGERPFVQERLSPFDEILELGKTRLAGLSRDQQNRLLGEFLLRVKEEPRARVVLKRGPEEFLEFDLNFGPPPAELLARVRTASANPAPPVSEPETTAPVKSTEKEPPREESPVLEACFATLVQRARRSDEIQRTSALERFRSKERQNPVSWAAARFLERDDREWRLVWDRLTTKEGAFAGTASGKVFTAFTGRKLSVSDGNLEANVLDPAAADLDALLAKFFTKDSLTTAEHEASLRALLLLIDRTRGKTEAPEALRLFALAHLSALGEKAAFAGPLLGLTRAGDRWGTADQLANYQMTSLYRQANAAEKGETAAAKSAGFGARYAAILFEIRRASENGKGFLTVYKEIGRMPPDDGPPAAAAHLKALAKSLEDAVRCRECVDGKIACARCAGTGRAKLECKSCEGTGNMPVKTLDGSKAWTRCKDCGGTGGNRMGPCPDCQKTAKVDCPKCFGRPWHEGACTVKNCSDGRVPCTVCRTVGTTDVQCSVCKGVGVVGQGGGEKTILVECKTCRGDGLVQEQCPACKGEKFVSCDACRQWKVRVPLSAIFTAQPCSSCGGAGWPLPNVAVPCAGCLGLGFKARPAADPARTLE